MGSRRRSSRSLRPPWPRAPVSTLTSTTSTPVCQPGAIGTRQSATVAGSTRAMRMATVSARSTSTRWRGRGPCYAPGCGHTGASRRRSCRSISASSSSCITPDAEAKLSLAPSSRLWSCDVPPSPRSPTRAIPDYYRRFCDPIDIAVLKTGPMDRDGYFNFGPTNLWHGTVVERAKIVIVEVDASMPYVYGEGVGVHVSNVDYVIDGDGAKLPELPNAPPSEIDRAVGRRIAEEIADGDCLQIGIGGMPNAVCASLRESGARNLGVHTEMLTDGIIELYKAGRITGAEKTLDPGKITYSFALGSQGLYDAVDRNRDFHCVPVECTNPPHIIMRNRGMVAINNTTQIDLQGQAASESDGHRHISGTGGQLQFVRGAYASEGGKAFICLSSVYERHGIRKSRIVLDLTPGNIVTVPRSDVMYVVTEYGMANLKGKSVADRARALIGIAHPDFREGLERQAYAHRLIPRGYC